jgi:hypothetical protein
MHLQALEVTHTDQISGPTFPAIEVITEEAEAEDHEGGDGVKIAEIVAENRNAITETEEMIEDPHGNHFEKRDHAIERDGIGGNFVEEDHHHHKEEVVLQITVHATTGMRRLHRI